MKVHVYFTVDGVHGRETYEVPRISGQCGLDDHWYAINKFWADVQVLLESGELVRKYAPTTAWQQVRVIEEGHVVWTASEIVIDPPIRFIPPGV